MQELDRLYWVAVYRSNGKAAGTQRSVTPKLYLSRKVAMASHRSYHETDEQLLRRMEFKPVKLVEYVFG